MSKWISDALGLNVCELDIQVISPELPLGLFTCKTLTKLKLVANDAYVFQFPSCANLPCLKTLDISSLHLPCVNAFKLIHGCPILESLSLIVIWQKNNEEYEFNIPTLKIFKLTNLKLRPVMNKVVLTVPNLEYIFIGGLLCSLFVMKDFPPLVNARVSFPGPFDHLWSELLKGISGAKSLCLCQPNNVLSILPLPKFPNLKQLELHSFFRSGVPLIPQCLESSLELEHLCIEELGETCEESCWIESPSVPTCMLKNLRTIEFLKCKGRKCDIQFLGYMLGNAEDLKTLTITCRTLCLEEEIKLCDELLKLPRASKYCEICFLGKFFHSTCSN